MTQLKWCFFWWQGNERRRESKQANDGGKYFFLLQHCQFSIWEISKWRKNYGQTVRVVDRQKTVVHFPFWLRQIWCMWQLLTSCNNRICEHQPHTCVESTHNSAGSMTNTLSFPLIFSFILMEWMSVCEWVSGQCFNRANWMGIAGE